jgi:hypothetical protein
VASGTVNDIELAQLLREAIESHNAQMTRCTNGQGIDRHLMGLRCRRRSTASRCRRFSTMSMRDRPRLIFRRRRCTFRRTRAASARQRRTGTACVTAVQPNCLRFSITAWKSSKVADIAKFKATLITALRRTDALLAIAPAKL